MGAAQPESRQYAITVTTLLDNATAGDGMCSLREAINNSNAVADTTNGDCMEGGGAGDTIVFSVSGKISLASTLPATKTLNLVINGGGNITLDGGESNQIFQVANGALDPKNLTLQNGSGVNGGAISASATVISHQLHLPKQQSQRPWRRDIRSERRNYRDSWKHVHVQHGDDGWWRYYGSGAVSASGSTFTSNSSSSEAGGAIDLVDPGAVG